MRSVSLFSPRHVFHVIFRGQFLQLSNILSASLWVAYAVVFDLISAVVFCPYMCRYTDLQ